MLDTYRCPKQRQAICTLAHQSTNRYVQVSSAFVPPVAHWTLFFRWMHKRHSAFWVPFCCEIGQPLLVHAPCEIRFNLSLLVQSVTVQAVFPSPFCIGRNWALFRFLFSVSSKILECTNFVKKLNRCGQENYRQSVVCRSVDRMQQEEASAMNKSSASGVEKGASIKPVHNLQQKSDQAVRKEQEEEKSSNKGQGEDQKKEDNVEDPSLQDLPSAKEPADFLLFRRSVVETDTMLE